MTWWLVFGILLVGAPILTLVTTGCWMLYKELKNEEEWGKIFTSMVISVSFGTILLLIYFIFTSRAA